MLTKPHFLDETFFSKASTNFSLDFTNMFKASGKSAQLRSLRQGKNRDHTTHQSNIYYQQKLETNLIFPYLSPIPKCPKLSHVAQEKLFSQNSKISKNCANSTREHSKEPPNLKLSKVDRLMNIGYIEIILFGILTWWVP